MIVQYEMSYNMGDEENERCIFRFGRSRAGGVGWLPWSRRVKQQVASPSKKHTFRDVIATHIAC